MSTTARLECSKLVAGYGAAPVLKGVSLSVGAGQIAAIVGPNGAGKSTWVRALMGLDVHLAGGTIRLSTRRIETWDTARRVEAGLGYVPEGRKIFGRLTTYQNLLLGAGPASRKKTVEALDRAYGLFPCLRKRADQRAGTLSGGEQQMLAVGRALMASPEVLILDEPSLGLSPQRVKSIFQTFRALANEGTALVLVEQNARAALPIADVAYVLEHGRVTRSGEAEALGRDEDVRRAYLGELDSKP